MASIPAYRRVYTTLKNEIRTGTHAVGGLLPTEPELEKRFSVSRTTVRKAVELLAGEGYLKVRQGRGTVVMDISATQRLNCITSVSETLAARGFVVSTQGMQIRRIPAPAEAAAALEIAEGEPVYQVQRVQCANGAPIALMVNHLRAASVPGLEQYCGQFTGLYSFLEKTYSIILKDAIETLSAVAADFAESQILRVEPGSPLLCSRRVSNTTTGVFEYSVIKLVADKYEYSVYLQGRS